MSRLLVYIRPSLFFGALVPNATRAPRIELYKRAYKTACYTSSTIFECFTFFYSTIHYIKNLNFVINNLLKTIKMLIKVF